MFRVHVFTPVVVSGDGVPCAGAELDLGAERIRFTVDLSHWSVDAYQRQWRDGLRRVLHGAGTSALMIAYRGTGDAIHQMWALWREDRHIHVQKHSVAADVQEVPFDPARPYVHIGKRLAVPDGAGISEWRIDLVDIYAAAFGIRFHYPS